MKLQFKLTKEVAPELLVEAISLSKLVLVDELDCSKSYRRQPTDKTVDEVLKIGLADDNSHYTFIFRGDNEGYFEIGFSTIGKRPDYFLWVKLSFEAGWELAQKYKLERY